jgi:hypothetical protein
MIVFSPLCFGFSSIVAVELNQTLSVLEAASCKYNNFLIQPSWFLIDLLPRKC